VFLGKAGKWWEDIARASVKDVAVANGLYFLIKRDSYFLSNY
jgi:hypothetical protein